MRVFIYSILGLCFLASSQSHALAQSKTFNLSVVKVIESNVSPSKPTVTQPAGSVEGNFQYQSGNCFAYTEFLQCWNPVDPFKTIYYVLNTPLDVASTCANSLAGMNELRDLCKLAPASQYIKVRIKCSIAGTAAAPEDGFFHKLFTGDPVYSAGTEKRSQWFNCRTKKLEGLAD